MKMRLQQSYLSLVILLLSNTAKILGFAPSIPKQTRISNFQQNDLIAGWNQRKSGTIIYPNHHRTRNNQRMMSPTSIVTGFKTLHSNTSYVLSFILWLSTFGISLERRTTVGKALSAPLATMALALVTANVGLLPFDSPIYSMINRYLVPLAVPLLLFDSDLKRVIRDTGTLLAAFGVGAFATIVGTFLAFPVIPLKSLGADTGWRVACALAARHIGG